MSLSEIEENPIRITTAKDVSEGGGLSINIQYPVMEGLENQEAQAAFNSHFEQLARECRERAIENRKALDDEGLTHWDAVDWFNYRITYNMNDLISVVTTDYEFAGGAHGMTVQGSYTMNLETGKVYHVSDLFREDADYRSLVSAEVKRQIEERGPDFPLLRPFESIDPDQEFYLMGDCLVVYFQLYEYTPYAWGIQEFRVDFDILAEHLEPGFRCLIEGTSAQQ